MRSDDPGGPRAAFLFSNPSGEDADAVTRQLGRPPRGEWRTARRCKCGLPQVIETSPVLQDGTPFPTRWWLTCKALCKAVSGLESKGWMRVMNEQLGSNEELRDRLRESMRDYNSGREL